MDNRPLLRFRASTIALAREAVTSNYAKQTQQAMMPMPLDLGDDDYLRNDLEHHTVRHMEVHTVKHLLSFVLRANREWDLGDIASEDKLHARNGDGGIYKLRRVFDLRLERNARSATDLEKNAIAALDYYRKIPDADMHYAQAMRHARFLTHCAVPDLRPIDLLKKQVESNIALYAKLMAFDLRSFKTDHVHFLGSINIDYAAQRARLQAG